MSKEFRPRLNSEEYEIIQKYRRIKDESNAMGLDSKDVKHGWLKSQEASLFFTNKDYEKPDFNPDEIDWDSIIKDVGFKKPECRCGDYDGLFDRVVYTDVHIGMNPNPDGYSQYGGVWDEQELMKRTHEMLLHIENNQKSDSIVVDDLGDLMDGWNGQTARKEHHLPQNMDNQKAFDVALKFKWAIYQRICELYKNVRFNNINLDNHSAAFGYVVNSAFKTMVGIVDKKTIVANPRRFINHYCMGDYVFLISHGKDDKNMKFGFKPQLDKPQMEKIDNYIDNHYLLRAEAKIEFSKGDSHQLLLDWSSSDRFNYFNYPAFSPSSNWVQINYKKGKSGFVMFNYLENGDCNVLPKFFDWKVE